MVACLFESFKIICLARTIDHWYGILHFCTASQIDLTKAKQVSDAVAMSSLEYREGITAASPGAFEESTCRPPCQLPVVGTVGIYVVICTGPMFNINGTCHGSAALATQDPTNPI